jgi:hypothetical protein
MSAVAVTRSSFSTSLARYLRSWGLWALLVLALVSSRFFVSREDGQAVVIAVHDHLPVMTSAMIGVSLGIVVSTLLLPIGFIYLRSNTNKRQPWQVEEVTAGSRMAIAFGRFLADAAALFAVLGVLTLAGFILAVLRMPLSEIRPLELIAGLWLVAGPAVMGLAALRVLFDAIPWTRGALGEVLYFVVWMASLVLPVTAGERAVGLAQNMTDFPGFISPLTYAAPSDGKRHGTPDVTIGATLVKHGRIPLDVMAGLTAPGYLQARLGWSLIACAVAAGAGLLYRPHRPRRKSPTAGRIARLLSAGPPRPAKADAPAARLSALPWLGLVIGELRLIGGRAAVAAAGPRRRPDRPVPGVPPRRRRRRPAVPGLPPLDPGRPGGGQGAAPAGGDRAARAHGPARGLPGRRDAVEPAARPAGHGRPPLDGGAGAGRPARRCRRPGGAPAGGPEPLVLHPAPDPAGRLVRLFVGLEHDGVRWNHLTAESCSRFKV